MREANLFPITNLSELSSEYRLFLIRGLQRDHPQYYHNRQAIIRDLSYQLKSPVTIIDRQEQLYLVVDKDSPAPPATYPVVRQMVRFEPCSDIITLDYTLRTPENDAICIRFLQFLIQAPLRAYTDLWQPASGQAFYPKKPTHTGDHLWRFAGFTVRVAPTHTGGLALCVDIANKFVGKKPLPLDLPRNEFGKYMGQHCIYQYGHMWYEIQVSGLSDFNVSEHMIPVDDAWVPLLNDLQREEHKPFPRNLADLPADCAVVMYRNNRGEDRSAPTQLCYPVYGPHDPLIRSEQRYTILAPGRRREMTRDFANRYLRGLQFKGIRLKLAAGSLEVPSKTFQVPDLRFGHDTVLSVRGTSDTRHTSLDRLGRDRLELLQDSKVGFYDIDPLPLQYFMLPLSVWESWGERFIADLKRAVNKLFPQKRGYDPVIITYDDRGPKTFAHQGKAIQKALDSQTLKPGYGVVMIHRLANAKPREEDQLGAMVMRTLRDRGVYVAIIHSAVGGDSYALAHRQGQKPAYEPLNKSFGKLSGYLRNVALNKVLLTSQRWPFVLATPLHADIVIGIDVKHRTAGLVIVSKHGSSIRPLHRTSKHKEKLIKEQMRGYLVEILTEELQVCTTPILNIVLHRDGRCFECEIEGAHEAIAQLKKDGLLDEAAALTILEIPKSSPAPVRLFDTSNVNGQHDSTENPQVGDAYLLPTQEAYLCSTGRVFLAQGTVRPLHIRHIEGHMSLEDCVDDVYALTALAWTRPEGCMRDPITIKLNDRFLTEEAADFDPDALEFEEELTLETEATYE